jgi:ABC-type phosphate transport system substrate-binding protein
MKKLKTTASYLLVLAGLLLGMSPAYSDIAIIVHPSNSLSNVSASDAARIYLGKDRSFPNDEKIDTIDQPAGSSIHSKFYSSVVKMNEAKVQQYWSRLRFSGKGRPPQVLGDDATVKAFVSQTPNAIGYIDKKAIDRSVKILLIVP